LRAGIIDQLESVLLNDGLLQQVLSHGQDYQVDHGMTINKFERQSTDFYQHQPINIQVPWTSINDYCDYVRLQLNQRNGNVDVD
jgi:uncharacterized membrane protein YpjA